MKLIWSIANSQQLMNYYSPLFNFLRQISGFLPLVRIVINAPNNQLELSMATTAAATVRVLGPPASFSKCI